MNKHFLTTFGVMLIVGTDLFAEAPDTAWTRTFDKMSTGWSVQQTQDGGYIITGGYDSTSFEQPYPGLLKTDSLGNEQWSESLGDKHGVGRDLQLTKDKGYIITGWMEDIYGSADIVFIKIDSAYNKEWDKTFGDSLYEGGWSVQETNGGGYIICGITESFGAGRSDVWLIKTDSLGNKEWDKTFGGEQDDYGFSIQQTQDGGYIIAGSTWSYGAGSGDIWLIKTDSLGNKEWDKTFGDGEFDLACHIEQTEDGGYIITGSLGYAGWLMKIDSLYNKEWDKFFSGDTRGFCVQQTQDKEYIITGRIFWYQTEDLWIAKTNTYGDSMWIVVLGNTSSKCFDWGRCVQQTTDGGYIICGVKAITSLESNLWLIKLKSETGIEEGKLDIPQDFLFSQNTPNPFPQHTEIKFGIPETADINVSIYSLLGEKVKTLVDEPKNAGYYSTKWDGTGNTGEKVGAGVYFSRLCAIADSKTYIKTEKLCFMK